MKICIATPKYPLNFESFITAAKASAAEGGNVITGYVVVQGPGCWNHGVIIEGDDEEGFAQALAIALMPSKWCIVDDDDPAVVEGQFEFQPEQVH